MEDQLVSFETATLAKEKGFNIQFPSFYHVYANGTYKLYDYRHKTIMTSTFSDIRSAADTNQNYYRTAPTQSLLQKWLREIHNIHIEILPRYQPKKLNTEEVLYSWAISCKPFDKYDGHNDVLNHWIGIHNGAPYIEDVFYHVVKTYEDALEISLQEALKLIP